MDAISSSLAGLQTAMMRFDASAQRVAGGTGDLATESVEQVQAKTQAKAELVVIRTVEDLYRRLLDIRA